jgi:hypothetical protein
LINLPLQIGISVKLFGGLMSSYRMSIGVAGIARGPSSHPLCFDLSLLLYA